MARQIERPTWVKHVAKRCAAARMIAKSFRQDCTGSVAVETSIVLPLILFPLTLAAIDVGIAVNSGQSLTSASRSGTQYLLNGGKSEAELKSAIVASYNGTLDTQNISISTSCVCLNSNAVPSDTTTGNEIPYTLRSVTLATIDQCSATCADASKERVVVNLSIQHSSDGLYKDYPLEKNVSVRVK